MHINVNYRTPVSRQDSADFIVQALVDILAPGDFAGRHGELRTQPGDQCEFGSGNDFDELDAEFIVGRIWAERLDWCYAEECGHRVFSICEAGGGTWMQLLDTISKNGGRSFRRELGLDNFVSDVVFVHEFLFHPEIIDRVAVFDAALRSLAQENSLVFMYHEQVEPRHLEDWECRDLGFKKIARSNLLIKDNHFRYPFNEGYTSGRQVELRATVEHETWLLENWESLIADHPSL